MKRLWVTVTYNGHFYLNVPEDATDDEIEELIREEDLGGDFEYDWEEE